MKIQPSFDRIIIKLDEDQDEKKTTKTGIILTSEAEGNAPLTATVVAVGPGKVGKDNERIPVSVNVGDRVLMPKFGGIPVEHEGEKCQLFGEIEVLGTFEE